jgi:regulator of protease activity HflC (stomatin/prohibitin superfamily)
MLVVGSLIILIVGFAVVAFKFFWDWVWSRCVYLPINTMVFIQSWSGKIRKETRPGVHFLGPFEWVMRFYIYHLDDYEYSSYGYVRIIPTSHVRIRMDSIDVVSKDDKEIRIDSWMMLRIADPEKLLINGSNCNPTAILMQLVRSRIIDQCADADSAALTKRPFRSFDFADIESKFGVEISMNIEHVRSFRRIDPFET